MLRLLFFADTHLGFDYPLRPRLEQRRRGPDFFANFTRVLDHARRTRPDLLIHGGDLFFRARIPQPIVDRVYTELLDFASTGIPLYIVPGNHERSLLPVSLFLNHPAIHIFDRPRTFQLSTNGTTLALAGFPCQRKDVRTEFSSLLSAAGWHSTSAGLKLLCLHQAIEGAQVGPADFTFRNGHDVIRRSDLPTDALAVLSGHIHRRQILGDLNSPAGTTPPVIYPGSIERTSFAEKDEPKGFYELQLAPNPGGKWRIASLEFIALPARPMHDLFLGSQVTAAALPDVLLASLQGLQPDSILRLRCDPYLDLQVRAQVTSRLLRELLPDSMNFQFSRDFFPLNQGDPAMGQEQA
jgi:exonuclease SbcD